MAYFCGVLFSPQECCRLWEIDFRFRGVVLAGFLRNIHRTGCSHILGLVSRQPPVTHIKMHRAARFSGLTALPSTTQALISIHLTLFNEALFVIPFPLSCHSPRLRRYRAHYRP